MSVLSDPSQASDNWLKPTPYIDVNHNQIQSLATHLCTGRADNTQKALVIFAFVRDEIKFGFAAGFWDNKASDVLRSGIGYCNTKSTLFIALLRAAGVPARQVFVDINASVLSGILDPGTAFVDHSYTEVFLAGRWIATDAYIVDQRLFKPAKKRAISEGLLMGYSVHSTGVASWDGQRPAFSQYNMLDPRALGTKVWGIYDDVGDFYARAPGTWNRLNALLRAGIGVLAGSANRRADLIRQS